MVIEIDENSGFCFGVRNAVETAEKALMAGEKIFPSDRLCIMI